jgi:hypothetical protein
MPGLQSRPRPATGACCPVVTTRAVRYVGAAFAELQPEDIETRPEDRTFPGKLRNLGGAVGERMMAAPRAHSD